MIDSLQRSFLYQLSLTEEQAFLSFNLVPLKLRRNIAALGFLHKIQLGKCHDALKQLFPGDTSNMKYETRTAASRHSMQIYDRCDGTQSDILHRSIFGMVRIYNKLPKQVVEKKTTKAFQRCLTEMARDRWRAHGQYVELFSAR